MRIERLSLTAFGPFTSEELDLRGGEPGGLHVVFGPNEAGKSTSLRAVRGFFFGIPERSQDAHHHPLSRLEVGAELSHDGARYALRRLKRRKDTLVDAGGAVQDEALLAELLGHVDERTFASRLGLDQSELERGAEALLGGSERGLFAAGTAGSTVRRVLDELETECGDIYKSKGRLPLLNQALTRYQEATRLASEGVRAPEKWLEQKRAQEEALARLEESKRARAALREEHGALTRLASLLSDLTSLAEVEARLRVLPQAPELEDDCTEARLLAERDHRDATLELARSVEVVAELELELAALGPRASLVDVDDKALDLRNRIGWEYKARQDLPKLEARLQAGQERLAEVARGLGFKIAPREAEERVSQLLPSPALERRARQLVASYAEVRAELREVERALTEARAERAALEPGEAEPKENEARLLGALAVAREARGLVPRLREGAGALQKARAAIERARAALSLSPETPLRVAFSLESVEVDVRELERLSAERRRVEAELRATANERADKALRLEQLRRGQTLPGEEELRQARAERDEGLAAVRRAPSDDVWERALDDVRRADDVADARFREHSRLLQVEELESEIERCSERGVAIERALEELAATVARLEAELAARFAGFAPVETSRPEAWLGRARRLLELQELETRRDELEASLALVEAELSEAWGGLCAALERSTDDVRPSVRSLVTLIEEGEAEQKRREEAAESSRRTRAERARVDKALVSLEERRARARAELEAWERDWAQVAAELGVPAGTRPDAVEDVLGAFTELSKLLDDVREKKRRTSGIARDSAALAEDLNRVVKKHAPDLLGREALDVAEELLARLERSRKLEDERERLARELEQKKDKVSEARALLAHAEARLARLARAAGVENPGEIAAVETIVRERRELEGARRRLRATLLEKSGGQSVESLLAEAERVEHKKLFSRIDGLDDELEEIDGRIQEIEAEAARLAQGLELYRSESAATLRQTALSRAAEARDLLRRYLVKKTALSLLEREITSYAERYSGPLARRAGELFERLTLGKYQGLHVGVGEKTMRCRRGGQEVEVEQLSRGTRAQLYFALRVASLEEYFRGRPPIPLVLDDLFVDFDDDRTTAAFEILGELAGSVQILYFTHLARDLQLAHDAAPQGLVFEHRLGQG